VIAVSQFEAQHAKEIGIRPNAIRTVINGINLENRGDRKAARRMLGLHDNDIAIGYVGRFSSEKGPDRLIEAFAETVPGNLSARLILTGDGPLLPSLKTLAADKAIDDRIVWTGIVNGREIMAGFDIFALASAYEAMPYVLLEAIAAGLPIVVTNVGGARTLVSDGENGFVTTNWDRNEFSQRLSELAANHALRKQMGRKSIERSVEYGVGLMIENTLAVYAEIIAKRAIK
jgi:glycosyltransferase involved in cell wall biosynthesis